MAKKEQVIVMILILLPLIMPIVFYPATATSSVHWEHTKSESKAEVKRVSKNVGNEETVNVVNHGRKLEHEAGSRGTNGGQPTGNGGGNTPVYGAGAGAANIHHNNHHNAGSSNVRSCSKFPALSAILLAYLRRINVLYVF